MDRSGHNNPQPVNAAIVPRFGAIPTFMRLPYITEPTAVDIALIGVPWDGGTTNRAGARHGPREIRNMSSFMRKVHHVSRIAPYELARVADLGDAPVNPIDLMDSLGRIERFFAKVHAAGAMPLSAGGDHLITLPIFRAIAKHRPIGMIHFDAHSDTNDRYFGDNMYTHGTPFRRAVEEGLLDPKRVVQIGIRGSIYGADDMEFAEKNGMRVIYMEEFSKIGVEKTIAEARRVAGDGPTYISFDVDGIDPAFTPGTGTPEIGGLTTLEAQHLLRGLQGLNLIGGDVVEVSPPFDQTGNTALVGATLMFEILCLLADSLQEPPQMSANVMMERMSWPEFRDALKSNPTVFLPCGATEQHGPHLPLSVDCLLPSALCRDVAIEVGGIVAPTLSFGYKSMPKSGGGPHFPGTLNLDATTLIAMVRDVIRELVRHGVRKICCVVGHYENQWIVTEGIDLAMRECGHTGLKVMRLEYWDFCTQETLDKVFPDGFPGVALEHAAVMETSMMMHYYPDMVRLELIPDNPPADFPPYDIWPPHRDWVPSSGALTSAKGASAAKGKAMIEQYCRDIAAAVRKEFG